nr:DUF975 family protein [uncultured Agathobaculum sp.]
MKQSFGGTQRRQIKRACRARVWDRLGRCIGIQVLYAVPYVLLTLMLCAALFGRVFVLLAAGVTDVYSLARAASAGLNSVWVILLLMLLLSGPLQYGLMKFYLGLYRGEDPSVSTLFQAFTSLRALWLGIRMAFCLFFRALLWLVGPTVLFTIALLSVTVQTVMTRQPMPEGVMIVLAVLYALAVLLISVNLLRYQAGWVVVLDDPDRSAWDATAQGSRVFRGRYGSLLLFVLSFVWWYLVLSVCTQLCLMLGDTGLELMGGGLGIAVYAAAAVAALCLSLVLGGFVNAYYMTSFIGMYETLSAPPAMGQEDTTQF